MQWGLFGYSPFGNPFDLAHAAEFDLWRVFRPEYGQCDFAQRLAELDLWREVQSEHGQCEFAQRLAELDLWS